MKAKLKSAVATEYRISYSTFIAWLREMPELNLKPNQRLLTPLQIEKIYEVYGNPND